MAVLSVGARPNGHRTDYLPKARREARRVTDFLHATLTAQGHPELVGRVPVRPLLAIVGGRLRTQRWPAGVTVVMTSTLMRNLGGRFAGGPGPGE